MHLHKEDVPTLDYLLDTLVKRDSHIFADDLKNFGKYEGAKSDFLYSEFKRLMYFFNHFGCGDPSDSSGATEWININLASAQFKFSGGFKNAYETLEKELDERQVEKDLKKLQKENLEYSQTIRDQEARIRRLTEELKFASLIKHYWWLILAAVGLGWSIGKFLDKI